MPGRLTRKLLLQGTSELAARDPSLAAVVDNHGVPPMWGRKAGYAALVKIILEQQVSLISAAAVYRKLESAVSVISPEAVVELSAGGLRKLGFTRQKAGYTEGLARAILDGEIDLGKLGKMSDEDAHASLVAIKGIGPWTANIYLIMALKRPDVWPHGDLALAEAARRIRNLSKRPGYDELDQMALDWQPWRAVAARILWHAYLCGYGTSK